MINLLPPDMKEQIRYAKINRLTLRYLRTLVAVVAVLAVIFGGTFYLQGQQLTLVKADVAGMQAEVDALNKNFTPKAKDVSDRLNAIKFVQGNQTHFSAVVEDIAKVVPQGVSIDSMTLTGDDKAAVRVAVTAQSYAAALAFRNALVTSPRIAGADLETISANSGGSFQTNVVIAFKPGMAK
jgi:Tfp pilus assembly protein PilN